MTATIHLWICNIQTKRRFNRVAAVISPHFYFMNYRKIYKKRYGIDFSADYEIHHIDMNRSNNDIENLILLPKELHRKLHNTYNNIYLSLDYERIIKFEYCSKQLVCSMLAEQLRDLADVYEKCQYWASCKEMEELALSYSDTSFYFNYNQFRRGKL